MRIAVLPFVSSAPIFIAESRGFFAAEGLDAELRFFQAAQPVALAVASGDLDFGVTGLTAGFYNLAGRGALKIIAGQARVEPGDEFMAYVAGTRAFEAGLRSLDDLPGRAVGITQIGSTFHYMVGRLAEKRGFPLEKVRLIPLESVPNVVAALRGGRIDAALLPGHLAHPLVGEGVGRILGWAGDETPWQLGAVFTSPRTLERRRATVEAFLRAYRRGAAVYQEVLRGGRTPTAGVAAGSAAGASTGATAGQRSAAAPTAAARALAEELRRFIPSPVEEILAGAPVVDPEGRLAVGDVRDQVAWFQARGLVDRGVEVDRILAPQVRDLDRPAR
ncbi:MAG TPA: ABC transporter substrate-binding protein [Thermoanaerobaculia bacterium]|nr:ABC transporter substrate-binding protein [Thermoanaerobaculia bacterium]